MRAFLKIALVAGFLLEHIPDSKYFVLKGHCVVRIDFKVHAKLFQNTDTGTLDGHRVHRVERQGGDAVHYVATDSSTKELFSNGQIVSQKVDWPRRVDNMQQHSGQHLV